MNFKNSRIYFAIRMEKIFRAILFLKKLFLILLALSFVLFLYGFFLQRFEYALNRKILGILFISLSFYLICLIKSYFFEEKVKNPRVSCSLNEALSDIQHYNIADYFSFEAARAVFSALKSARSPEITSTHILYFILKNNPEFKILFSRLLVDYKGFMDAVRGETKSYPVIKEGLPLESEEFKKSILNSLELAHIHGHEKCDVGDLLYSLAKEDKVFKEMLIQNNLKAEDIEDLSLWMERLREKEKLRKSFWKYENLAKRGTLAKHWTSGFTLTLDRYSEDITEQIKKSNIDFAGHSEELNSVERILSIKGNNNVLLVGNPGTGRRSIVYHLAKRSLLGSSMEEINYKRVVELDISSLLAQIESVEETEVALDKIFQESLTAGNIILVLDNIHDYIGREQGLGIMDISGVISPYLRLSGFKIIAIADYEGLHRNMEKNPGILSLFEKVEVSEISRKDTITLLQNISLLLEQQYNIFIPYPSIREAVSLSERYFPSLSFPEKAIELMRETVVYVASRKEKAVLPSHVSRIVSEKSEIPVGEIEQKEKDILINLEDLIHKRIINQEEAVREVSSALRRARAEITVRQGPMGAFLFLGPTGVGKTETAKALAEIYFGSESNMIRLDMSEFQNSKDISRLIGSPSEQGLLTSPVREKPFSLILLDEIEKSHPNILNIFLQVFDEGHITDGLGRKVDFRNTIIIATSNAGYEIILKSIKEKEKWGGIRQKMIDFLFQEKIFRPEFLNRFDAFVVFAPLSQENLKDIAGLMLGKLKKNLLNKGIEIVITEELKEEIARLGYNPVFGARHMRRVVQEKIENPLAQAILKGYLSRGSKLEMNPKDFNLIVNNSIIKN